jgi:fission 1 protein
MNDKFVIFLGQTKLGNYEQALKYTQSILNVQPNNEQVLNLQQEVNKRMKMDGLIGLGIAGSAALVGVVGVIGLGAAMIFGKKS